MTTINMGVFSEIATGKADVDLRNVDLSKTDILIEYMSPTAANNYTWYRLYASGWVEQGGITSTNVQEGASITFSIIMQDTNYTLLVAGQSPQTTTASTIHGCHFIRKDTTGCSVMGIAGDAGTWVAANICWQVSGKANMTGHEVLPNSEAAQESAIQAYEHRIIDIRKPTAENNYTWYRKYADGWVEQGGIYTIISSMFGNFNLIVPMADTHYFASGNCTDTTTNVYTLCFDPPSFTTTTFSAKTGNADSGNFTWEVKGLYA